MGHNHYLDEFQLFNPWIVHTGLVTWVPEVKLYTKCVIKVSAIICNKLKKKSLTQIKLLIAIIVVLQFS